MRTDDADQYAGLSDGDGAQGMMDPYGQARPCRGCSAGKVLENASAVVRTFVVEGDQITMGGV